MRIPLPSVAADSAAIWTIGNRIIPEGSSRTEREKGKAAAAQRPAAAVWWRQVEGRSRSATIVLATCARLLLSGMAPSGGRPGHRRRDVTIILLHDDNTAAVA